MPVCLSKFMIDLWIGAAPLHLGKRDAWILMKPFLVKFNILFGIICPYATTIAISAFNSFKYLYSSLFFFNETGALNYKFNVSDILWIGDLLTLWPLCDFRGGWVYTTEIE